MDTWDPIARIMSIRDVPLTLDEGIEHLQKTLSDPTREWSCGECKKEHLELLGWLLELREWRSGARRTEIPEATIAGFMVEIKQDILDQGGTQADCDLVTRQMVINAIRQERDPSDVAWAVMQ